MQNNAINAEENVELEQAKKQFVLSVLISNMNGWVSVDTQVGYNWN